MLNLTHPIDPSGVKEGREKGPRMSFFRWLLSLPLVQMKLCGLKTLLIHRGQDGMGSAVLLSAL